MNHSGNDRADERAAEGEQPPRGMMKEREPKDDGRYIIYYTFEDEEEGED